MEKWENRKKNYFPLFVFGWRDEIFFYLVEKKNEKIENVVCINL